jgi:hypothetical protein
LKAHRNIAVAVASFIVVLAMSAPAFAAYSSTVYPAGDSISASSVPVTVTGGPFGIYNDTCTLNGGTFTVGAHNLGGPVTLNYSANPTYTSCTGNRTITISTSGGGAWKLAAQYGQAATTVTVPSGGLQIFDGVCTYTSGSNAAFTGSWNNGFTSPANVSSAITVGGAMGLTASGSGCAAGSTFTFTFGLGMQTLTDTTHPTSLPLLGP